MFQLNVEILQQSGLDKWRQTHLWSGYMTLMIVNLKGYWLWRKEIQKLNFIGNFNVGTPRRSGSDQWRQTDMWNGYMTLKIVNLRGSWLYEKKFKNDIWSKYLILMIVNLKKILTLQENIQNRQMERIHDTHHSPLERILTWQMEI